MITSCSLKLKVKILNTVLIEDPSFIVQSFFKYINEKTPKQK